MPVNRFYAPDYFEMGKEILLVETEHMHLSKVCRTRVKEMVELVNGQNVVAIAELLTTDKRESRLRIVSIKKEPPLEPRIILAIPLIKQTRLEWAIEKAVELAVSEIWLFPASRDTLSPKDQKRLEAIIIAAMKQCGRLDLPPLLHKPKIEKWTNVPQHTYFGAFREQKKSLPQIEEETLLVVGPESGLTENEEAHLEFLGAKPISLAAYTLRSETAALYALCSARKF